ncbi:MAG: carboxypeptidase-like regulatory domain-containing protein [Variovorax sp.]
MKRIWFVRLQALTVVSFVTAFVTACGGGGGGGGGGGVGLPIAGVPGQQVVLSGTATYDSVPNTTGALAYSAASRKPVRGALVEVVNEASAVLATATTDGNGAYSVSLPSGTPVIVRVKAQLLQGGSGPNWDVSVRDNTQADALYAMETPAFSPSLAAVTRDVHAPSGWDGTAYTSARVAGPFAILDAIYAAQTKVLSVAPASAFPSLRVFWSVNNLPAPGRAELGQIGTTFFGNRSGGRVIYVLGKEGVDTDEYDASVVAHEWGHYYQSAFSRDDSPGGGHSLADRLDRRVAFSEGWGNAWSGIALARSNYTDSSGPNQAQGSNLDLNAGAASNPGWFREGSIHSILWKLNSQVGFKSIHDTLTGSFKNTRAVTSIHPFTAAFSVAAPGEAPVFAALLAGQSISPAAGDPFGVSETNNGGVAEALPMYRTAVVGTPDPGACVTNQAGAGNKLGNYVYLRFTAPTARTYTITATAPSSAADPDLVVYSGGAIARADDVGASQTLSVALTTGEHVLAVNDFNNTLVCLTVTIQ